ncbi:MAG: ribosome-binding factor A [Polyangiaceae bacterium]
MKREEEKNEGAGHRHLRLQGLIFEELRALLRDDVSDPALLDVRVTAVVLSVDYRHARIHYAVGATLNSVGTQPARTERALARATAFFRARLSDALDLKRVPDLRFVFDGVAPIDAEGGA